MAPRQNDGRQVAQHGADSIDQVLSSAAADQSLAQGEDTADDEDGGGGEGLDGLVQADAAGDDDEDRADDAGNVHGDDAGSHGNQNTDEDQSDQNHLLVSYSAVRSPPLISCPYPAAALCRRSTCTDAAHQQGQADLGVLEEAELPQAHILQDAVCHDVGGGTHQRDGAAQRGEEGQSHQQLGLLDASLGDHGADDGHQTGSGAGIVQECGQAAGHKAGAQQQALFGLAQQTDDLAADKVGQTGLEEASPTTTRPMKNTMVVLPNSV